MALDPLIIAAVPEAVCHDRTWGGLGVSKLLGNMTKYPVPASLLVTDTRAEFVLI